MRAVGNFHKFGLWPRGTNASFITLIPKVDNPQCLDNYRPISLVSSFYKIITKVLANRLKVVLKRIIDFKQSTFLENRGILDNVLAANEAIDEARKESKPCIVFKVDFEKAYDSVNWDYLGYMLGRLGFSSKWIKWIKGCMVSSSVSVLVNESPTKEFIPEKGLRQGDPLAHFLFLIVVEGLAGEVREAKRK